MIYKHYLYLSKLAAQMVTSTSLENLFYQRYGFQNPILILNYKDLDFTCLVDFFQGDSPNKIME